MYHLLTPTDQETLVQERVRALEADHFRERMLYTESATEDERLTHEQNARELERRIQLHLVPEAATREIPAATDGIDPLTDGDETDT